MSCKDILFYEEKNDALAGQVFDSFKYRKRIACINSVQMHGVSRLEELAYVRHFYTERNAH